MPSGVSIFCGFVEDFSFLEDEEKVKLFPASGVIIPIILQNWVQWLVSMLRFCITTGIRVRRGMMDIVNFSLLFYVSFMTFSIGYVVCQSKIFISLVDTSE